MHETTSAVLEDYYLFNPEDKESIKARLISILIHTVGVDPAHAEERDWYYAIAHLLRSTISENTIRTQRAQRTRNGKRVYYLSMEYLLGSSLIKNLIDLDLCNTIREVMVEYGLHLENVAKHETDAALGNGGLGRLAACFLDSLATHRYPGFGYGIRYEYGMFTQRVEHGQQIEHPENWLRYGNPWEFERSHLIYTVRFGGRVMTFKNADGTERSEWVDADEVVAMAFDMPIAGYDSGSVTPLRLWSAKSSRDFDLRFFNEGNYVDAVRDKTNSENLSKVLYPNDSTATGQELRLKQEYFFVAASLADIMRRHMRDNPGPEGLKKLSEKVIIQLNDTHPAMAVAEMMRLLVDEHHLPWADAWALTKGSFAYTNHTLLPEALEVWGIDMMERVLPRHLQIIYRINHEFLQTVRHQFPGDPALLRRVSLVDDERRAIRMAYLAIVASTKVNGVAALHTELMQQTIFADFAKIFPDRFVNMTNGVTPRRWVKQSNPPLSTLINSKIDGHWLTELSELKKLEAYAGDAGFQEDFRKIKAANKERLAHLIHSRAGVTLDPTAMFDVQVKRIHEYKRQLLNLLHVVARYNRIREGKTAGMVPRSVIFAGKAAPGYAMAKHIIHLINDVADIVNNDPKVREWLRVVFMPNYNVSGAEIIMPGSDLSEQISTAGTEASGTGNMKFALNGALTIGTLDGANIEIREEVGKENIFIFGMTAHEVEDLRLAGYNPWNWYHDNAELKLVMDMIGSGYFCPQDPARYKNIFDSLTHHDQFMLMADYQSYVDCQARVDANYTDQTDWTRKAIINVANMGKFSSDRTIHSYANEIWGIEPLELAPKG